MKVFLGGTCNGSMWRDKIKPMLKNEAIDFFDPVVDDWNEAAYQRELLERESCDFVLYVITPAMSGVYSIAEVVDDSNKRPKDTILVVLQEDGGLFFQKAQLKSLSAVSKMIEKNGAMSFDSIEDAVSKMKQIKNLIESK